MDCCKNCSIEDKILQCCGKNPLNGESKKIIMGHKSYNVCTEFDKNGECRVYDHMPRICREYQCDKIIFTLEREMIRTYNLRTISALKSKSPRLQYSKK